MAFALGPSQSTASGMCSTLSMIHRYSSIYDYVPKTEARKPLSMSRKLAYGVGHVLNDLCASMWFTYVLIFFNKVLQFDSRSAGLIVLVGQIADGLSTPVVGYFSDRSGNLWLCKYGRRKTWHLVGTICEVASFPFIFSPCHLSSHHSEDWVQILYYVAFVIVFQFGWASVQISNLSLVPELTPDNYERTLLLAIRYSFTVMSNMVVYVLLWIVLQVGGNEEEAPITPKDTGKFQIVAFAVVILGCITSVIFHVGTHEMSQEEERILLRNALADAQTSKPATTSTFGIFKRIQLYQVALLYMMTRLFANISQTMFPMYLHDVLFLGRQGIAVLPLVMYALSFMMALVIKPLNKRCGRKGAFCFGAVIGIVVSVWVRLGEGDFYKSYMIYIIASLYGIAASALLVTSLGITADMIGQDLDNGAFIYGLMSFFDKLSNGAVVMMIQSWMCWPTCITHYRDSLAYVCGGAAVIGALAVVTICTTPAPTTSRGAENELTVIEQESSSDYMFNTK